MNKIVVAKLNEKWRLTSSFYFATKDKPKVLDDLRIGDEVVVILKGKVRSLFTNIDESSISIERSDIKIEKITGADIRNKAIQIFEKKKGE